MVVVNQQMRGIHTDWLGRVFGSNSRNHLYGVTQIGNRIDVHIGNNCGLFGILVRQEQMLCLRLPRPKRNRQCAANRAHPAIQGQFAYGKNVG